MTRPDTGIKPSISPVPPSTRKKWLRDMLLIREFELRTMQAYQEAKIGGFCHVYIGQEACAVGCLAAVNDIDPVITAYRDHGHALARGTEARYVMAEMFGRLGGCSRGKGGSMHMFDRRHGFLGGHAIVGGQTPLGVGIAFATKYENEVLNIGAKRVTLCFLGDGALNQGSFHEAMNLAAVLELPVLYIVENNQYAMGTAIDRGTSMSHDLSVKSGAYGIPFYGIDGMDVMAVYTEIKKAADWSREHQKPGFAEVRTYRYKGHSMSDPQKYRTKEEVGQYEANDPIRRLADSLLENGDLDDAGFKQLSSEVRLEVRDAIAWAEQSPEPDPAVDLYSEVVTEPFDRYGPNNLPEMFDVEREDQKK